MWRRAEWVIVDGTFYPSLTSHFCFLAGPCGCRDSTRGSGRCQPSLDYFSRRPSSRNFPALLACLPAGSLGLYAVSKHCIHTSGSGLGMATWLAPPPAAVGTAGQDGRMVETGRGCKVRRGLCLHSVCAAMGWVVVRFTLNVDDYVECMSLCRKRQILSINYLHGVRNCLK